jgi:hypothetical protein
MSAFFISVQEFIEQTNISQSPLEKRQSSQRSNNIVSLFKAIFQTICILL